MIWTESNECEIFVCGFYWKFFFDGFANSFIRLMSQEEWLNGTEITGNYANMDHT